MEEQMAKATKNIIQERVGLVKDILIQHKAWAWVFPSADPHMSEYLADHWKIRAWISGFQGSAGTAVVLADGTAALWTDGRYFIEAESVLKGTPFVLMKDGVKGTPGIGQWISSTARKAGFGVSGSPSSGISSCTSTMYSVPEPPVLADSLSVSPSMIQQFQLKNVELIDGLMDKVWLDRPAMPSTPVRFFNQEVAGQTREEKLSEAKNQLSEMECDAQLISALDELAWLLNLRGGDVECNPVFYGYLVITSPRGSVHSEAGTNPPVKPFRSKSQTYAFEESQGANPYDTSRIQDPLEDPLGDAIQEINNYPYHLFIDKQKINQEILQVLEAGRIKIHPYLAILPWLEGPGSDLRIVYSPKQVSAGLEKVLIRRSGGALARDLPVTLQKSKKNSSELSSWRDCMIRDGQALVRFLVWFDQELTSRKEYTEVELSRTLRNFRAQIADFQGDSFESIIGFKGNGAIIHYRPEVEHCATIQGRGLLLIDSGAQYDSGTTDITRTLVVGEPDSREKELYTRVLQGHIALSRVVFPPGTLGTQLDILARKPLWDVGLNYGHGTGHGVGFALNVHEGPGRISPQPNPVALEPGMVFSNEPGYYEAGGFGIRIENLVAVQKNDLDFLEFEILTLCPYEPKLIQVDLLNEEEIQWINTYHRWVWDSLSPGLSEGEQDWLRIKTRPL